MLIGFKTGVLGFLAVFDYFICNREADEAPNYFLNFRVLFLLKNV